MKEEGLNYLTLSGLAWPFTSGASKYDIHIGRGEGAGPKKAEGRLHEFYTSRKCRQGGEGKKSENVVDFICTCPPPTPLITLLTHLAWIVLYEEELSVGREGIPVKVVPPLKRRLCARVSEPRPREPVIFFVDAPRDSNLPWAPRTIYVLLSLMIQFSNDVFFKHQSRIMKSERIRALGKSLWTLIKRQAKLENFWRTRPLCVVFQYFLGTQIKCKDKVAWPRPPSEGARTRDYDKAASYRATYPSHFLT